MLLIRKCTKNISYLAPYFRSLLYFIPLPIIITTGRLNHTPSSLEYRWIEVNKSIFNQSILLPNNSIMSVSPGLLSPIRLNIMLTCSSTPNHTTTSSITIVSCSHTYQWPPFPRRSFGSLFSLHAPESLHKQSFILLSAFVVKPQKIRGLKYTLMWSIASLYCCISLVGQGTISCCSICPMDHYRKVPWGKIN